jgi:dihydroorotase
MYCMPVIKTEPDRLALRAAATSGEACFFLGTDSAPHPVARKLAVTGVPGIFNAPVALATYAQVFEEENALDKLEAFASLNGPRFYGLPANEERITLQARPLDAPERIEVPGGNKSIVVFRPDTPVGWSF